MIEMQKDQALGCRVYEPTPKDVRRACEEIQATWSPRERAKRAMIRLSELVEAIDGARAHRLPHAAAAGERGRTLAATRSSRESPKRRKRDHGHDRDM